MLEFSSMIRRPQRCVVGAPLAGALDDAMANDFRATPRVAPTLGHVIGAFKSITTHEYIDGVKRCGWTPFSGKVWQRNYYEHVVRNDRALDAIRNYIDANPSQWADDPENPERNLWSHNDKP